MRRTFRPFFRRIDAFAPHMVIALDELISGNSEEARFQNADGPFRRTHHFRELRIRRLHERRNIPVIDA